MFALRGREVSEQKLRQFFLLAVLPYIQNVVDTGVYFTVIIIG